MAPRCRWCSHCTLKRVLFRPTSMPKYSFVGNPCMKPLATRGLSYRQAVARCAVLQHPQAEEWHTHQLLWVGWGHSCNQPGQCAKVVHRQAWGVTRWGCSCREQGAGIHTTTWRVCTCWPEAGATWASVCSCTAVTVPCDRDREPLPRHGRWILQCGEGNWYRGTTVVTAQRQHVLTGARMRPLSKSAGLSKFNGGLRSTRIRHKTANTAPKTVITTELGLVWSKEIAGLHIPGWKVQV